MDKELNISIYGTPFCVITYRSYNLVNMVQFFGPPCMEGIFWKLISNRVETIRYLLSLVNKTQTVCLVTLRTSSKLDQQFRRNSAGRDVCCAVAIYTCRLHGVY